MNPIALLIVDDDPVFARFLQQVIVSLGDELPCGPAWVDSAEKAFEELSRHPYELVLLDYNLPGADGLAVLDQIRQLPAGQQPAVAMLTASGNEAVAVEAMKRGARDYLSKADLDRPPLLRAVTTALSQKRLADQVALYNAQQQTDMEMARRLQQSLLPHEYPRFPRAASVEQSALRFCHRYHSAAELGGDFFAVLDLSDTEAGILICDVMGHGIRAALVTAMLRTLVGDLAPGISNPGKFLGEMNRKLIEMLRPMETPLFATAFYLIADVAAGRIRYANAGHPHPLHLCRRLNTTVPLATGDRHGPALGLFADTNFPTCEGVLAPNDALAFFTDGLFEITDPAGVEYGPDRLLSAVRSRVQQPLEKLFDEVLAEIQEYAAGQEFSDDVCLIGADVRQTGVTGPRLEQA